MFMFRESDNFGSAKADEESSNFTHFDTLRLGSPLSPLIMSLIFHFIASVVHLYPVTTFEQWPVCSCIMSCSSTPSGYKCEAAEVQSEGLVQYPVKPVLWQIFETISTKYTNIMIWV